MSITDAQFRIAVGVAGLALVLVIATLRFAGDVSLPAKPPPPGATRGTSSQLLTRSTASPTMYLDFLAQDAAAAGLAVPAIEQMSRKLVDRVDSARHVLEVDAPAIELAGLQLRALHLPEGLALEVTNATGAMIAYDVETAPLPSIGCDGAQVLRFNAMTIAKDQREVRIECGWREGSALAVTRVETLEVPALSAWYLDHVPPAVLGIEPRIARGHRGPQRGPRCAFAMSQAVRSGLERGEIRWRDLADFYARHRCETYHFPLGYRAFEKDGERSVPAVAAGM